MADWSTDLDWSNDADWSSIGGGLLGGVVFAAPPTFSPGAVTLFDRVLEGILFDAPPSFSPGQLALPLATSSGWGIPIGI